MIQKEYFQKGAANYSILSQKKLKKDGKGGYMEISCERSELRLRYRPDANEIEAYIGDLGEKGKYVKLQITQETVVKCLPLSGTIKCDQIKGKEKVSDVIKNNGKSGKFGFTLYAQITGTLFLGNGGRFSLKANSIMFPILKCPFGRLGKPCRFTEPLSAFTPVLNDLIATPPEVQTTKTKDAPKTTDKTKEIASV